MSTIPYIGFSNTTAKFKAGQLALHIDKWAEITSDQSVLDSVSGYHIDFLYAPEQHHAPRRPQMSLNEASALTLEIEKLLLKGVLVEVQHENGEFVSPIFTRPKKDGSRRLILNLKHLNNFVAYHHFKMESIQSATQLMKPNCWMAILDLKDAYYTVSVAKEHRKFLRFEFGEKLYEFVCLPNGLSSAPRVFTKLLKPPLSILREKGILIVAYIDDLFFVADTPEDLERAVAEAVHLLEALGFTIHEKKSKLQPAQQAQFLGFMLNSIDMTVSMVPTKAAKVVAACKQLLSATILKVCEVASVVGQLVACFPAVTYGPLYYRALENNKTHALKANAGDLHGTMQLSQTAKNDLLWWIQNVDNNPHVILRPCPDLTLKCDSSLQGWGSVIDGTTQCTGGRWSYQETKLHINTLELKAIYLGLQALCSTKSDIHIKVLSDNQTAVAYIKNMGGTHSDPCNDIARQIILWCKDRNVWLSISHIPGKLNTEADQASREFNDDTEWSLNPGLFNNLVAKWGKPEIDLFASRLNNKVDLYVSWRADPGAFATDSLSVDWSPYKLIYCFPPFSLIGKVLQKIQQHQVTAILVVPLWKTQFWYPLLVKLMVDTPIKIQNNKETLTLPYNTKRVHPLYPKLQLLGCLVSGKALQLKE